MKFQFSAILFFLLLLGHFSFAQAQDKAVVTQGSVNREIIQADTAKIVRLQVKEYDGQVITIDLIPKDEHVDKIVIAYPVGLVTLMYWGGGYAAVVKKEKVVITDVNSWIICNSLFANAEKEYMTTLISADDSEYVMPIVDSIREGRIKFKKEWFIKNEPKKQK